MKKVLVYILAAVMVFSIAGCGSSSEETEAAGTEISAEAGESQMGESLMPGSEEASSVAEGEQAEEGEAAEGEADGEAAEGEAVEGEAAEGESQTSAESAEEDGETVEAVESQTGEEPDQEEGETAESGEEGEEGEEGAESQASDGKLVVAASSTLRTIMDEQFIPQFNEKYPDIAVEMVYDSSENLQNQIESGAAFDLIFIGGKKYMSALQEEGMVIEGSVHALMTNELAFVVPRDSRLGIITVADLEKARSVAIGDPIYLPVGEYTIDTLKEQELWEGVKEKEVYLAASVEELLGMLIDGTADCGFVYQNDAVLEAEKIHIVEGFAPTTYRLGILTSTGRQETATEFIDFMSSDEVLAQLVANGFTLPES